MTDRTAAAPTLAVLTWAGRGHVYGVTWSRRGSVGAEPEAITVDVRDGRQTLYVAATDRGILSSEDQGRTFTARYSE